MTRAALSGIHVVVLMALAVAPPVALHAQSQMAGGAPERRALARRVTEGTIRLDGLLDEEAWKHSPPLTDFVQKEPNEGASSSQRMEVHFAYDSRALYVGFQLWSHDPLTIQAPLGRRDSADQAEHVTVSLDTYHDRRTAYTFGVTAAGVRIDRFHPEDSAESADAGFDPVWEARTAIGVSGWSAELWIPFSQLRFNSAAQQVWGLNVGRIIPALNEEDYWVAVPRTVTAWASRFGDLAGIDDLPPVRRLELLPYVSASAGLDRATESGNPFSDARTAGRRFGLDLKLGLSSSLTLNVAVNPDFGQVEADPAEVNLTAFETVFPEKRPFFTEGAGLMNLGVRSGANLFNSRRIGGRPIVPVAGDFVDYPDTSTILVAAKVTGRTASGTSIGLLGALTDQESARASNAGSAQVGRLRVAPRTGYGVGRVQQEFGATASTVSVMGTVVTRDVRPGEAISTVLPNRALGFGSDAVIRLKDGEYEATFLALMSHVSGDATAIERLQRAPAHYFQRPDRAYSRLDSRRTSMTGYKTIAGFERRSGRHWLWDTEFTAISPGLETNDIGRTLSADGLRHVVTVRYRETQPGKLLRAYSFGLTVNNEWTYDGDQTGRLMRPSATLTLSNFWTVNAVTTRNFRVLDPVLTRGGPLMQRPSGWTTTLTLSNALTSETRWSLTTSATTNEDGGTIHRTSALFAFRPSPRWQLSAEPIVDHTTDVQQYLATLQGGRPETYGLRYVFSTVDRTTLSVAVRAGLTVRPDLNLDAYLEPFASSGRYADFGELRRGGTRERLLYGANGTAIDRDANGDWLVTTDAASLRLANPDFSVRSLRSNVVLRWEWRPGSTLYAVWQQDHERRDALGRRSRLGDLISAFAARGQTVFALKGSFWIRLRQ